MQMKIHHKEYYKQCEILFHIYKQGFMKKSAFGEQNLCFSAVPGSAMPHFMQILTFMQF